MQLQGVCGQFLWIMDALGNLKTDLLAWDVGTGLCQGIPYVMSRICNLPSKSPPQNPHFGFIGQRGHVNDSQARTAWTHQCP